MRFYSFLLSALRQAVGPSWYYSLTFLLITRQPSKLPCELNLKIRSVPDTIKRTHSGREDWWWGCESLIFSSKIFVYFLSASFLRLPDPSESESFMVCTVWEAIPVSRTWSVVRVHASTKHVAARPSLALPQKGGRNAIYRSLEFVKFRSVRRNFQ
jgi:hypothetical protein